MSAPDLGPYNRLAEFLATRYSWLQLVVIPGWRGGWDIALRVDGTYFNQRDAENLCDYLDEVLVKEYDVDLGILRGHAYGREGCPAPLPPPTPPRSTS